MGRDDERWGGAVLLLLTGVVGGLLGGCGTASATAGAQPVTSSAVASTAAVAGPGSGDVIVHGTVTGADGPAEITVALWPTTDDTEVGEAVDILTLPTVTADAAGHWVVALDPDELDESYLSDDAGFVNYDVNVATRSQEALWSSTAFLVGGSVWRSSEQASVADGVTTIDMDLAGRTVTLTDSEGVAERAELTLAPPRVSP